MLGNTKGLSLGMLFSFMFLSSIQAWQLEFPTPVPGVEIIVSKDPGIKLGIPFLGGVAKHTLTISGVYKDGKQVLVQSSKFVIGECLGGFPKVYTFSDSVKKRVAVALVAGCLKDDLLKKKLEEFYDIKQRINMADTVEKKKELQKQCIKMKYLIKRLMK